MIEFSGYLTGAAQKCFYKRVVTALQIMIALVSALEIPIFILIFGSVKSVGFIIGIYFLVLAIVETFTGYIFIIDDKRQMRSNKKTNVPKRIYIKDKTIVSISNQTTIKRKIGGVKEVRDYGEYYVLAFPIFNNYSPRFICQKSLLTKGSIEEFESLFEGKIVKKG